MPKPYVVDEVTSELDPDNLDPSRVLVVGADPAVPEITAISWDQFAANPGNIADYSLVVLGLDSYAFRGGQEQVNVINSLNRRWDRFLMGPATELVLVGWHPHANQAIEGLSFGLSFIVDAGDFVTDRSEEFRPYLSLVDRYSWLTRVKDANHSAVCTQLVLAAGRDMLGVAYKREGHSRIVVLPAPSKWELDEGITILLTTRYDLEGGAREPPAWLDDISLPDEERLRERLIALDGQIEPLLAERDDAQTALAQARTPLNILYESGPTLETSVRNVLRTLGAEVTDPQD